MSKIRIIGLGAGGINQMNVGVYRILQEAIRQKESIYLRTALHPVVATLTQDGLHYETFDSLYEQADTFESVYQTIVEQLIGLSKEKGNIIYAVPGHPMVAESVVQQLLNRTDVEVVIEGGSSFIDDLMTAVQIDAIDGFQLVDALDFRADDLVQTQNILITQVFNGYVASDVKLELMKTYPDDYQVALIHAAGTSEEKVDWLSLYEIDRLEGVYNLTTLFVPKMTRDASVATFRTLQHYMDCLAEKDMWLQEQTHKSLMPYLEEETHELKEAIANEDIDNIIEELGDVLWQVLFHTSVAEYDGYFNLEDVLTRLNQKIRHRAPHVFDGVKVNSIEELYQLWQQRKDQEKTSAIR